MYIRNMFCRLREKIKLIPKEIYGILVISFFLMTPTLHSGLSLGHDIAFHRANMFANIYSIDFSTFHFFPCQILGNGMARGFGYGTGLFYPPLASFITGYIGKFIHLFVSDLNPICAISITEMLVLFLSGFTMYLFMYRVTKKKKIAFLSAISYMCSPYFLCDIYVRSAISEIFTFIFIPLVFLGIYELFYGEDKNFYLCFIIGYVGMLFSHLVLTVYLTILIIPLLFVKAKDIITCNNIKKLLIASSFVLLLTLPFWVPMLEHKLFGNYVVFGNETMYSIKNFQEHSLTIGSFFDFKKVGFDGIIVYFNFAVLILSIVTIMNYKRLFTDKKSKYVFWSSLYLLLSCMLLSTKYFPWNHMPNVLKMIQFPWRLCTFMSFGISILAGYALDSFKGDTKKLASIVFSILILFFGMNTIFIRGWDGSNNVLGAQAEYLPIKTKENMDYYKFRDTGILVVDGNVSIHTTIDDAPYMLSSIALKSKKAVLELPRIYYLGYKITLTDSKGKVKVLDYEEDKYGFIQVEIENGGTLEVKYKGTILNRISNVLAVITLFVCIFLFYRKYSKKKLKLKK